MFTPSFFRFFFGTFPDKDDMQLMMISDKKLILSTAVPDNYIFNAMKA